jgi:hypothetical protein
MEGKRDVLNERAPMSPVSVEVFNILRTPALANVSLGGGGERCLREAPVAPETLLARLLRPLTLEIVSVKGIVPPFEWLVVERVTAREVDEASVGERS